MDYTQLIERLKQGVNVPYVEVCISVQQAATAIEALQARVKELEGIAFNWQNAAIDVTKKLAALEGQSPTALALMTEYSNGKQWALEEAERVCKQMETAIDGGGNTYYRPADARQCVEAIRKIGGSV